MQKDTDAIYVKASSELDPIMRISAGQLKLPMRDGYMPTHTLPFAGWEWSTTEIEAPKDAVIDVFLNAI